MAALYHGHENVVQILRNGRNDINDYLIAALLCGHKNMVQMLLKQGADITQEGQFQTALIAASGGGHEMKQSLYHQHNFQHLKLLAGRSEGFCRQLQAGWSGAVCEIGHDPYPIPLDLYVLTYLNSLRTGDHKVYQKILSPSAK